MSQEEVGMSTTSLGELIAQGSVADIHAWGESQIVKLFHDWVPAYGVEHEARNARLVYDAGLSVPAVGEIIEVDGRFGLIYERVEGSSMAESFLEESNAKPETVLQLAHLFAELHAEIHNRPNVPKVPSMRPLLERVIHEIDALPLNLKEATLKALDQMPDGDRLCHGDFHPYNVLISPHGPVIIDWNNAVVGDPLEDVARTTLILSGVPVSEPAYRSRIDQFVEAYLERYFQLRPYDKQQLLAWQPIVAAVRLSDNIPGLQEWLLEQIRLGLALPG